MRAVVDDAPRSFAVREVPESDVGPGDVRIRTLQVGICATDLLIHNGDVFAASR